MKKTILVLAILLLVAPIFAQAGIIFGADVSLSGAGKPYVSEDISFKYKFKNGIALDAGLRVIENITRTGSENSIYFAPNANFNYKAFYIGGGVLCNSELSDTPVTFFGRLGFNLGDWQWGSGLGCINFGLEVSPMLYWVEKNGTDASSAIGAGIATAFLSVLNCAKVYLGLTYFLPFNAGK